MGKLGFIDVAKSYVGNKTIGKSFVGNQLVYDNTQPEPLPLLMAGTNRSQIEGYANLVPTTPTAYSRGEFRLNISTGRYPLLNPRFIFPNWGVSAGDKDGPNSITNEAAYETISPVSSTRITFGGQNTISNPSGGTVMSDPLQLSIPQNTAFKTRVGVQVAPGGSYYFGYFSDNDSPKFSNSPTSQVLGTGEMSMPSGGSSLSYYSYGPVNIVGELPEGAKSIGIFGDSIGQGVSENEDSHKNRSFITKALQNVPGGMIPNTNYCRASEFLSTFNGSGGRHRREQIKYHNVAICQFGANDLGGSPTLAAMKSAYITAWTTLRDEMTLAGHTETYVAQTTIFPRNVSEVNTAPYNANYASGGLRDELNAWFQTQIGIYIDAVIDAASLVQNSTDHTKFAIGASADGTHLSTAGSVLAQPAILNWADRLVNGYNPVSNPKLAAFYTSLDADSINSTQWLDQTANARHATKIGPVTYSPSHGSAQGFPAMVWPNTQAGTPTGFELPGMTIAEVIFVGVYKDGTQTLFSENSQIISGLSGANGNPRLSGKVNTSIWQDGTGSNAMVESSFVEGGLPTAGTQVSTQTALPSKFQVFDFRPPIAYTETGWKLGYNADLANRCWCGAMVMVMLFSEVLTVKERYEVYGYLNKKLGKSLPIPSWSIEKTQQIVPNISSVNAPYYPQLMDMRNVPNFPSPWAVYSSGDHITLSGIYLHLLYGENPEFPTAVESYDEALAAGKFNYLSTKPPSNPVYNYTGVGNSTETPRVRKIGNNLVMTHQQAFAGNNQSTLRVKGTDGVNFTYDKIILDYNAGEAVGDGHTGYFQWGINIFKDLIDPLTGVQALWVGYSLHGGTGGGFFAQWVTDDPVNGEWRKTVIMQKTLGRAVGDVNRFCSLIGIDIDSIRAVDGGYSALIEFTAPGGAAGAGVPNETAEVLFDTKGQQIIGRPITVLTGGAAGTFNSLGAGSPTHVTTSGKYSLIYQANNSTNSNAAGGAVGDRDLAPVAKFSPLLPAIPTYIELSVDFSQIQELPEWLTIVQEGTIAPTYSLTENGLEVVASSGTVDGSFYLFVDRALVPNNVNFIEMDIEGWSTPSENKQRIPFYGLGNVKAPLSIMTDAYYGDNNKGIAGGFFKQQRVSGVNSIASPSPAYWGFGYGNYSANAPKRLGLRWFNNSAAYYLTGELGQEFEKITLAGNFNKTIGYYPFWGFTAKAANVTERIKKLTVRYGI